MEFSKLDYTGHLIAGNLKEAVEYLKNFPEKNNLVFRYLNVFESDEPEYDFKTLNVGLQNILKCYYAYYKEIFWLYYPKKRAEKNLLEALKDVLYRKDIDNLEEMENEVEKFVENEGYNFLGGLTSGFYGPYIWKSSEKIEYKVEIPYGIQNVNVIMMDGFISRSWLDFISFGETGTGGWVTGNSKDLWCVYDAYKDKIDTDDFKISYLKHEAQHLNDRKYVGINNFELEYRAKLVELIYRNDDTIIKKILKEANASNKKNGHSYASYLIIKDLSKKIFKKLYLNVEEEWSKNLDLIKKYSLDLLDENTKKLNAKYLKKSN